jgi:chromosome segregation ATPase
MSEKEPSEREKRNTARSLVRKEIEEKRAEIRNLRLALKEGQKVGKDLEACEGYLLVLKRELVSIEEGGHTTFLDIKKQISPKFNVDSKKEDIKQRIDELTAKIEQVERLLTEANRSPEERTQAKTELNNLRESLQETRQEMQALNDFNHTRFIEMKEAQEQFLALQREKNEKEQKMRDLKIALKHAKDSGDTNEVDRVMSELNKTIADKPMDQSEEPVKKDQTSDGLRLKFSEDFEPPPMI